MFNSHATAGDDDGEDKSRIADGMTKKTVLAIDDDKEFLDLLRPLLKEHGFTVMTSSSGPKGLNILRYGSNDISVVMLDFNMPQFNGAETLQYVRRLAPHVKVVGLTGVDLRLLPVGFQDEVDYFLQKPFTAASVSKVLNDLIEAEPAALAASHN
jgi:CheY-like chemotaxis protein